MTYRELCGKLRDAGIEDYKTESMILITALFGVTDAYVVANPLRDYGGKELLSATQRRKKGEPLQYITGKWQFMGLDFFVSPDCLIPRQDTEILVEKAIKKAKDGYVAADFCTGSGCIGISLLKFCPNIKSMLFADISKGALDMAKKNVYAHGVEEKSVFLQADVIKYLPDRKFDMILSNPPYIPTKDIENLSKEVKSEPRVALDGGEDGLDIIKRLAFDYTAFLKDGGSMFIEFGYDQGAKMDKLLSEAKLCGLISSYEIVKDYGGNDRLAVISK